jgi:DNA-binding transcriptional LysR family regulator
MQSTALRYFCEVVRCGSLRRAAEVLHIAPSAISRQIVALEHRLKAPLFERQTNRLVLTEEGRIVAENIATIEADMRRVQVAIDDVSKFRRGHVRIATVEAMVAHIVPKCVGAFQNRYPNLTVSVNVLGTFDVVDAVIRDTVDIGIAFCPDERAEVDVKREFLQPLHVIMSPSSPLASSNGLSLSDLSEFRVALPNESFGIRRLIESVARTSPVRLVRCLETNSIEMVKGLARHSTAITFLPESAVIEDIRQGLLCAVPLTDPALRAACIRVLSMKGRVLSRAANAFLESLDAVAKEDLEFNGNAPLPGVASEAPAKFESLG